jgi:hypothetical protein
MPLVRSREERNMPRLVYKRPGYLRHKLSGRARVSVQGKYHYCPVIMTRLRAGKPSGH